MGESLHRFAAMALDSHSTQPHTFIVEHPVSLSGAIAIIVGLFSLTCLLFTLQYKASLMQEQSNSPVLTYQTTPPN